MASNDQYRPMVEIAEEIIRKNGKQSLNDLVNKVGEIKGFTSEDAEKVTLLYLDMTLSGNFVYCGNDEWDLKENNLELWDKDGSYFMRIDEVDFDEDDDDEETELDDYYSIDEDDVDFDDEDYDDEDEEDEDYDDEDDVEHLLDDDIPFYSTDDDDIAQPDLDFDDEDYHDIMDDYEDMYDD
ncbi:MAG: DNA-directed RNA polymerase subunit delta [Acholeplasmataceae bacterium]|jgi:DNA-directed RNA polymerase subunit delta